MHSCRINFNDHTSTYYLRCIGEEGSEVICDNQLTIKDKESFSLEILDQEKKKVDYTRLKALLDGEDYDFESVINLDVDHELYIEIQEENNLLIRACFFDCQNQAIKGDEWVYFTIVDEFHQVLSILLDQSNQYEKLVNPSGKHLFLEIDKQLGYDMKIYYQGQLIEGNELCLIAKDSILEIHYVQSGSSSFHISLYEQLNEQQYGAIQHGSYPLKLANGDLEYEFCLHKQNNYQLSLKHLSAGYYDLYIQDEVNQYAYLINGKKEFQYASFYLDQASHFEVMIIQLPCFVDEGNTLTIMHSRNNDDCDLMVDVMINNQCVSYGLNNYNNYQLQMHNPQVGYYQVKVRDSKDYEYFYRLNQGSLLSNACFMVEADCSYLLEIISEKRNGASLLVHCIFIDENGHECEAFVDELVVKLGSLQGIDCFKLNQSNQYEKCLSDLSYACYELQVEECGQILYYEFEGKRYEHKVLMTLEKSCFHEVKIYLSFPHIETSSLKIEYQPCDNQDQLKLKLVSGEFEDKIVLNEENDYMMIIDGLAVGEYQLSLRNDNHYQYYYDHYELNALTFDLNSGYHLLNIKPLKKQCGRIEIQMFQDEKLYQGIESYTMILKHQNEDYEIVLNQDNGFGIILEEMPLGDYRLYPKDSYCYELAMYVNDEKVKFQRFNLTSCDCMIKINVEAKKNSGLLIVRNVHDLKDTVSFLLKGRGIHYQGVLATHNNYQIEFEALPFGQYELILNDDFYFVDNHQSCILIQLKEDDEELWVDGGVKNNYLSIRGKGDGCYSLVLLGKDINEQFVLNENNDYMITFANLPLQSYQLMSLCDDEYEFRIDHVILEKGYFNLDDSLDIEVEAIQEIKPCLCLRYLVKDEYGCLQKASYDHEVKVIIQKNDLVHPCYLNDNNNFTACLYDLDKGHYELFTPDEDVSYLINDVPCEQAYIDLLKEDIEVIVVGSDYRAKIELVAKEEVSFTIKSSSICEDITLNEANQFHCVINQLPSDLYEITSDDCALYFVVDNQDYDAPLQLKLQDDIVLVEIYRLKKLHLTNLCSHDVEVRIALDCEVKTFNVDDKVCFNLIEDEYELSLDKGYYFKYQGECYQSLRLSLYQDENLQIVSDDDYSEIALLNHCDECIDISLMGDVCYEYQIDALSSQIIWIKNGEYQITSNKLILIDNQKTNVLQAKENKHEIIIQNHLPCYHLQVSYVDDFLFNEEILVSLISEAGKVNQMITSKQNQVVFENIPEGNCELKLEQGNVYYTINDEVNLEKACFYLNKDSQIKIHKQKQNRLLIRLLQLDEHGYHLIDDGMIYEAKITYQQKTINLKFNQDNHYEKELCDLADGSYQIEFNSDLNYSYLLNHKKVLQANIEMEGSNHQLDILINKQEQYQIIIEAYEDEHAAVSGEYEVIFSDEKQSKTLILNKDNQYRIVLSDLKKDHYDIYSKDAQYEINNEKVNNGKLYLDKDCQVKLKYPKKGKGCLILDQYLYQNHSLQKPQNNESYQVKLCKPHVDLQYELNQENDWHLEINDLESGIYVVSILNHDQISYIVNGGSEVDRGIVSISDDINNVTIMVHSIMGCLTLRKRIVKNNEWIYPPVNKTYHIMISSLYDQRKVELNDANQFELTLDKLAKGYYVIKELDSGLVSYVVDGKSECDQGCVDIKDDKHDLLILNHDCSLLHIEKYVQCKDGYHKPAAHEQFIVEIISQDGIKQVTLNNENNFMVELNDLAYGLYRIEEKNPSGKVSYQVDHQNIANEAQVWMDEQAHYVKIINESKKQENALTIRKRIKQGENEIIIPADGDEYEIEISNAIEQRKIILSENNQFEAVINDLKEGIYQIKELRSNDYVKTYYVDGEKQEDYATVVINHHRNILVEILNERKDNLSIIDVFKYMLDEFDEYKAPNEADSYEFDLINNEKSTRYQLNAQNNWHLTLNVQAGTYQIKEVGGINDIYYLINSPQLEQVAIFEALPQMNNVIGIINRLQHQAQTILKINKVMSDGSLPKNADSYVITIYNNEYNESYVLDNQNNFTREIILKPGGYHIKEEDRKASYYLDNQVINNQFFTISEGRHELRVVNPVVNEAIMMTL